MFFFYLRESRRGKKLRVTEWLSDWVEANKKFGSGRRKKKCERKRNMKTQNKNLLVHFGVYIVSWCCVVVVWFRLKSEKMLMHANCVDCEIFTLHSSTDGLLSFLLVRVVKNSEKVEGSCGFRVREGCELRERVDLLGGKQWHTTFVIANITRLFGNIRKCFAGSRETWDWGVRECVLLEGNSSAQLLLGISKSAKSERKKVKDLNRRGESRERKKNIEISWAWTVWLVNSKPFLSR